MLETVITYVNANAEALLALWAQFFVGIYVWRKGYRRYGYFGRNMASMALVECICKKYGWDN
jgi:hypothetical protein